MSNSDLDLDYWMALEDSGVGSDTDRIDDEDYLRSLMYDLDI